MQLNFDKNKNPLTYAREQGDITQEEFETINCEKLNKYYKANNIQRIAYVSAEKKGKGFEFCVRSSSFER